MFKRQETMSIKEFMAGKKQAKEFDWKPVVRVGVTIGVTILSLSFGDYTFASANAVQGAMVAKVTHAFEPLVQLVKALSYPICLTMMLGGGLYVMVGMSDKGLGIIQKAGLGYVLVQLLPMILNLLVEITKGL